MGTQNWLGMHLMWFLFAPFFYAPPPPMNRMNLAWNSWAPTAQNCLTLLVNRMLLGRELSWYFTTSRKSWLEMWFAEHSPHETSWKNEIHSFSLPISLKCSVTSGKSDFSCSIMGVSKRGVSVRMSKFQNASVKFSNLKNSSVKISKFASVSVNISKTPHTLYSIKNLHILITLRLTIDTF